MNSNGQHILMNVENGLSCTHTYDILCKIGVRLCVVLLIGDRLWKRPVMEDTCFRFFIKFKYTFICQPSMQISNGRTAISHRFLDI